MNKSNLVEKIYKRVGSIKKNDIEESINYLTLFISNTIIQKNRVEIRGFGTFSSRLRPARLARNPKTGSSIAVDSKLHTYFRPSKLLKEEVKN